LSDILSPELPTTVEPARARITAAWTRDETEAVDDLLSQATLPPAERELVLARAPISRPPSNRSCASTTFRARKACS
jgi:hypothetical protein